MVYRVDLVQFKDRKPVKGFRARNYKSQSAMAVAAAKLMVEHPDHVLRITEKDSWVDFYAWFRAEGDAPGMTGNYTFDLRSVLHTALEVLHVAA